RAAKQGLEAAGKQPHVVLGEPASVVAKLGRQAGQRPNTAQLQGKWRTRDSNRLEIKWPALRPLSRARILELETEVGQNDWFASGAFVGEMLLISGGCHNVAGNLPGGGCER